MGLHGGELHIDGDTVRLLIDDQFPHWRDRGIERLAGSGTTSAIFRIGSDIVARFPLRTTDIPTAVRMLLQETAALREFSACSPYPGPLPVAQGSPGHGYPLPWSVTTWVPGNVPTPDGQEQHSELFASDLVVLLRSLRAVDPKGRCFSGPGRGGNLHESDEWMEVCFQESLDLLPVGRLRELWTLFRQLPSLGGDRMTHGDLIPGNLLVARGRLIGVLDSGSFAAADPALDLVVAWHLLDGTRRDYLRRQLRCSDLEWCRGAAWAFQQSMGLVWYYRKSNPAMSRLGWNTLSHLDSDSCLHEDLAALRSR